VNYDAIETLEHKGHKIDIYHDSDPESPREWCNLGTMALFHSRMDLGDNWQDKFYEDELEQIPENKDFICLPVYAFEHGGITISTGSFSCVFDSGQLGIIFADIGEIKKEWGWIRLSKKRRAKIEEILANEVETYAQFLEGRVYGYTITDRSGEEIGSCWGFYGEESVQEAAKEEIDFMPEGDRQSK
tara:strand:- start:1081 stop:1641 length:561 start_codon:yes stop_codon:yes gene_type:complete